ncbi:MAG TPA: DNA polymerase III subunit alpha [Actinomycetota bacterium]|nr:DNA polymerase III subunit alpha [Actinomycetota bacterium]
MSFVHLHAHSEYSMLDGASRIGEMFEAAEQAGMPACAITDHGVMYGVLDFYRTAQKSRVDGNYKVKPILGMEGYLFGGDRREKPPQKENGSNTFHLTLLAQNDAGYKNLMKISSRAWLEGFHYWPRTDHELLAEYSDGLICLSGCLSAEIPKAIVSGDLGLARRKVAQYREVFGDRFYLELQDHGIAVQAPLNDELVKIGTEMGIPWVATNDSHYTHKDDSVGHDVLLCINTGSVMSDPQRFKFDSDEFYLKTPEEMERTFARWPGACENTLAVAERCNVEISMGQLLLPRYEVPQGKTLEGYLRELVYEGLQRRGYGNEATPQGAHSLDDARQRADFELKVIEQMGFAGYFLVVQDFVNWSKDQGIRVGPGRGSAAGSIVSYALGVTELDPLRYDLMFERFLNPERIQMPDIDIDFDDRKRGDVIRYVCDKYGKDHVAQIVTYGTIKGKQAIKDAARVLGFPYQEGDRLTRMYPPLIMGRDSGLASALDTSPELKEAYDAGGAAKEIIDTALKVENLKRSAGIHAAGVVIGRDPLVEHVPLKRGDHEEVVTQFDMNGVEELGLLKMDFLGLRNLTVIELARDYIRANRETEVDVDNLDFADPKVYEMLQRGDTDGVFQLESDGMRRYLAQLKPTKFEHIMAMVALYRPGPMDQIPSYIERMHNPEKITYLHPELEDITKETYGVLVYQEQIVLTLQRLAGYTPGQADLVRKAIGKKKRDIMAAEKPRFIQGCVAGGVTKADADHLWGLIERFADYSFNRAHAACYAYIAYQTGWLKAHYPVEYMAALLTSVKDRKDDKPKYLSMARKMAIPILIPDVNSSDMDFTPTGDSVRFGLSAVRGVGEGVVERIVEARQKGGPFTSFHDFCRRVDYACLNRKTVESLIKAGAYESLGHTRKGLLDRFEDISAELMEQRKMREHGQFGLFDSTDDDAVPHDQAIPLDEHPKELLLAQEKEVLGRYVSDHPLLGVEGLLARMTDTPITSLGDRRPGDIVTIGGIVAGLSKKVTRRGEIMVLLQVEDVAGASVEVVVFPRVHEQFGPLLRPDAILLVKGRVDQDARDDSMKMMALEFHEPDLGEDRPLVINMSLEACTQKVVDSLKDVLANHPGTTQVFLHLAKSKKTTVLRLGSEFSVDTSNGLHAELKALLGPTSLV